MVTKNKYIELINKHDLEDHTTFYIINCIINSIDLIGAFELKVHLIIKNCIINNFQIHSCWFVNGLTIRNSIIVNFIDYQMGGHNTQPIILEGNVFLGFFNFFDCQFEDIIKLKNNVFEKGTNLLGNKGEGFENRFEKGWVIENNIGRTDINEVEM
ncbi:MAG: hypothetical protein ACYC2U_07105 [Candidatus Amoebophilus sp.]